MTTVTRPREAALLETATRLFRQRGFHATSMQDIAEAMGMNRGSLYHYIAAKDDLLWSIVSGALARLHAQVEPVLASAAPPPVRLREAIEAHLRFSVENGDELALLQVELRAFGPERRAELLARRDAYEALWRAVVAEGIADGTFRPVDVRLSTIAILSVCNWFTQWYRPEGPLTADEIGDAFAALFLLGMETHP